MNLLLKKSGGNTNQTTTITTPTQDLSMNWLTCIEKLTQSFHIEEGASSKEIEKVGQKHNNDVVDVDALCGALQQHVAELDQKVHQDIQKQLAIGTTTPTNTTTTIPTTRRIGEGLGNQNVMVKDKETWMKTNHQLFWTSGNGVSKSYNIWEWLIG
eukprot:PhF_6_TR33253/c0_g1_i1/m.48755